MFRPFPWHREHPSFDLQASLLVTRHCRFHLTGASLFQPRPLRAILDSLQLPWWWRMYPSSDGVQSHTRLHFDNKDEIRQDASVGDVVTFDAECHIERRFLDDPVCVGVHSGGPDMDVEITTSLRFDVVWLFLVGPLAIVTFLCRVFVRKNSFQRALCVVLAARVLVISELWFVGAAMSWCQSWIGRIIVATMIALSGMFWAVKVILVLLVLACGDRSNHEGISRAFDSVIPVLGSFFGEFVLGDIMLLAFTAAQLSLVAVMGEVNLEATVIAALILAVFNLRVITRTIIDLACRAVRCDLLNKINGPENNVTVQHANSDASDRQAFRDRFAAYSEETRKELLDDFAATVRSHPEKYSPRFMVESATKKRMVLHALGELECECNPPFECQFVCNVSLK